jgi:outer membrane protein assembly factor BamB
MKKQPRTFPYLFSITCVCTSEDSLFLGTYRNSNLNEEDNCIRSLGREYKESWKIPVQFSPAIIVATPDQVLALTHNIYSGGGILYCLRRDSGELLWNKKVRSISPSSELLIHNESILCIGNSEIAGYALKNGKKVCAVEHGSSFPPKVQGGSLICCSRKFLAKLRLDDLHPDWTTEGLDYPSGFGCNAKSVFVGDDETLQLYDLNTGKPVRRIRTGAYSAILANEDDLFFQSEHDNTEKYVISRFTAAKSKPVWSTSVPICIDDALYSPQVEVLTDKTLIARAAAGPVYALDRKTGRLTMLVSESDMPDKGATHVSPLFLFQNQLSIQYGQQIYLLAEFPSPLLGSAIRDADRELWKARR